MIEIDDLLKDKILRYHNEMRSEIAVGNIPGFDSAVKMTQMVSTFFCSNWNDYFSKMKMLVDCRNGVRNWLVWRN